ncbi:hypothetical protein [Mycolicibacterium neworleansense]|uniref:Fatty acyl-AMP ligase FadD28 and polyketide synthase n=1 Tax=Mycolicibacterium neworleansense TaxID=146018 RepID=A0A0H5RJX3_9MYCO|nr:hypothetical protein [Mycolicibacterium neworleansense]MCV7360280.1 hypothetical protein [Mycolicibacterium neworleansense]CRZ14450.1 Fatty acyl-AMP ligase FadD28 and polyketide synthase [Mycolicibacterium neworleansense]
MSIRRTSKPPVRPDNRLALADEALLAEHQAAGMNVVIQVTWLYERPVDLDGLRRFHHNLGRGLLGRRIERPALPIARHRWVADRGPSDVDVVETIRPRTEFGNWVDERSQLPVNAQSGPGWHIGVLPLDDGSTAVSLVLSHNLIDGLGLALVIVEGVLGKTRDLDYPPPLSRTRLRALGQDVRQTARDVPNVARALVSAVKSARKQTRTAVEGQRSSAPRPASVEGADEVVLVPALTIYVDLNDWDARATALGGASHTLAAAFAAKFGQNIGRVRAEDGAVTLQIPISDRADENDTRAMALSYARVTVDPAQCTTDLSEIRAAVKQTLRTLKETSDESKQLLWLPSFVPKRMLKQMVARAPADPDQAVFSSYLGDLSSLISQADGTLAAFANARTTGQRESRQLLERTGGRTVILSGRISGKIFISVGAYQPGAENTTCALRELATRTLTDFGLTGEIH